LKRAPFNLRPLLAVPKTQNPKGLALFLGALLKLSKCGWLDAGERDPVQAMADRIAELRSTDARYWSWGYSFPWQTRTIVVPRGTPNLVCTTFVASALLDAYEARGLAQCLEMAASAADYIHRELIWTEGQSVASLAYPLPSSRSLIHNANFLGAALLCRVARLTGRKQYVEPALRVARYSAGRQAEDGSWVYGELPKQRWIDNFHTGFNLCALQALGRDAATGEFEPHLRRGFEFYRRNFYREDGAARYFHNRTYPIDIHSVAQSIITPLALRDRHEDNAKLARAAFAWAMKHMWDERGFFYYRVLRFLTIKTSYMRWSQSWMLLALSTLLEASAPVVAPPLAAQPEVSP
jgi:mannose/cellobiose epimerase-like protein (N-acyl-D-glucosamine 2-epimerase family)